MQNRLRGGFYILRTGLMLLAGVMALLAWMPAPARAAGLLIADGGLGGVLEIKEHDVKVTINNGVAVTTVTQIFQNTEDRQVEALYTFPVPQGASVANFSMWINGKEMIGEVLEKKRAREIYESYKKTRRDPGLLEQVDYRTFEMRIFPIGPRAEQRVQVVYYQELNFDGDWATYVYPLATATRADVDQRTTGKFALSLDVKSEIPITELQSTSHEKDFAVARHDEKYYQASLETKGGDLSRDVVLSFHTSRPRTGVDLVASRQGKEDGYFSLTLTAGEELAAMNQPMDYIFVLDISGSMNDNGKLELSRKSLGAFINALGETDRFEVMTFNVQPRTLFNQLSAADDASKQRAADFLASQEARGGTMLSPAVTTAYKYADAERPLNVILLSDGLSDQAERSGLIQLIRRRPANTRVFAIGVGNDVNRALLEQLTHDSGGLAAFLSREDNFQRQAQAFRRKLLRPVASDLKIDFAGVEVYDVEPRQLPNLYHGMPVRLYGRYKGDGEAKVSISGKIAGKDLKQAVELGFPESDDSNPEIERMWAWHRVDRLLKEADAGGSRTGAIDEIIRLGEGYSIVTEYTSFIVLENDAEYQRWKIDRKNVLRIGRDRGAQQAVATKLETMRAKAGDNLGPAGTEPQIMQQSALAPRPNVTPQATAPNINSTPRQSPRNRDFNIGNGNGNGGGGAIDPISGMILLGLAGLAWAGKRRAR